MNDYEILLLLDPELPDERQNEIVTRTRETIEKGGGSWSDHQPWGRRRLAYEIDHKPEGAYHLLTFDSAPETLDEVSRVLRITDGVMRHLAVRRVKGASGRAPEPSNFEPSREEPRQREPRREEPSHEEPRHEEPRHEESSHEEPRPEEPSQEEPLAASVPASQDSEPEEIAREESE